MITNPLFYALVFSFTMIGIERAVSTAAAFYNTRYRRELWLDTKARRKLTEAAAELIKEARSPDWEPVEEEEPE